jgi:hypothetical protein
VDSSALFIVSVIVEEKDKQAAGKAWTLREFGGKTLWDWLQLLVVPAALAVIGFLFSMQQDARQQLIEDHRAQQARRIENRRAEAERELAALRTEQATLQAYLDQMTMLLLDRNLREGEDVSAGEDDNSARRVEWVPPGEGVEVSVRGKVDTTNAGR